MNKPVEAEEVIVEKEPVTEELEVPEGAPEGGDGTETPETDDEVTEIVLEGDDGSQPVDQNNLGIRKRINKLNAKVSKAEGGETQANTALANEQEKNTLLRLQLAQQQQQQQPEPSKIPDSLDFDGGVSDPKYVTAMNDYHQDTVRKILAEQAPKPEPKTDAALVKAQTRHYEEADKLGISDYEAVEDAAIKILGRETINQIIGNTPNSHLVVYHLGINEAKSERIADLIKRDPIKGVMELGALAANLKATKVKRNHVPNPDEELEGTTLAKGSGYERKLEKMRAKVASGGATMSQLIEFKRDHKGRT